MRGVVSSPLKSLANRCRDALAAALRRRFGTSPTLE
jgi:hypothetical protein